ncbi:hypothetical protein FEM48_Zijuj02G0163700 [Ziziphus jujuba var. spinosa]|uniref:EF-hand domain-containing protein n=1 Tax=Ziziphus jujuba var. spinosa TaxID=714518 RepID=A0A978VWP6_ZIZJJ|nr:hypothetical protein FEM48_Zijuj02G0163700 [Ziziphus jujuba var. spinosa]
MSDGALTVLDGSHLRAIDCSLPSPASDVALTGARVLEIADSRVSSCHFGLSLPQNLKSSALRRINILDDAVFRSSQLDPEQASDTINLYITAIADQLKDDPLVVSILDGKTLRLFFDDEDDFAMLAEDLFTDLDAEDKGKICKSEIRNALLRMGIEMGVPPISDFPLLNDILKKHGADGKEELGQGQFAQLLQQILQELSEVLAEKNFVFIQNIKIINGSKLRKLLADEVQLGKVVEKIFKEKHSGNVSSGVAELTRSFLEKNGIELGLPPSEANEAVVLLYDAVFADVQNNKSATELERDEFASIVKEILGKFAEQLEANPVFHDLDQ